MLECAHVKVSILADFGNRDAFVQVAKCVRLLEQALRQVENRDCQIMDLPRAVHWPWEAEVDSRHHAARARGFHSDHFATLTSWLQRQRLGAKAP